MQPKPWPNNRIRGAVPRAAAEDLSFTLSFTPLVTKRHITPLCRHSLHLRHPVGVYFAAAARSLCIIPDMFILFCWCAESSFCPSLNSAPSVMYWFVFYRMDKFHVDSTSDCCLLGQITAEKIFLSQLFFFYCEINYFSIRIQHGEMDMYRIFLSSSSIPYGKHSIHVATDQLERLQNIFFVDWPNYRAALCIW